MLSVDLTRLAANRGKLDGTDFLLQVLELLVQRRVFLGHLLVFLLPLVAFLLESLNLALKMSSLDIGLSEPVEKLVRNVWGGKRTRRACA